MSAFDTHAGHRMRKYSSFLWPGTFLQAAVRLHVNQNIAELGYAARR